MSLKTCIPSTVLVFPFASIVIAIAAAIVLANALGISGFSGMPFIRVFNVLVAGLFVLLFLLQVRLKPRFWRAGLYKPVLGLLVLNIIYLGIGLLRGNNKLYLLTDCIYLTLFYLTFLYGAGSFRGAQASYSHRNFIHATLLLTFTTSILSLVKVGTPSDMLILWAVALVISIARREHLYTGLLVLAIAPQLPTLNRAIILAILSGLIVLFFSSGITRKVKVLLPAVAIAGMLAYVFTQTDYLYGTGMERRIKETAALLVSDPNEELPLPLLQRMYEGQMVNLDIANGFTPGAMLFGMGHGYTLNMSQSVDPAVVETQLEGSANTHNIHLVNYALQARFGLLGSLAFLAIFVMAVVRIYQLFKQKSTDANSLELVANLYVFLLIMFATTASSFLFSSMLLGYFCGVANQAKVTAMAPWRSKHPAPLEPVMGGGH